MRHSPRLVLSCLAVLAACSHSAPAETSAAQDPAPTPVTTAETSGSESSEPVPAEPPAQVVVEPERHHHHESECGEVTVTFASGSYALDTAGEERLTTYAACLTSERARVVYVTGTTDPSGSDEDNLILARARGRAVADYLHTRGLHTDFEIHALGEAGALPAQQVWPLERAATVSDVRPH